MFVLLIFVLLWIYHYLNKKHFYSSCALKLFDMPRSTNSTIVLVSATLYAIIVLFSIYDLYILNT